ncbi:MAG: hypothetical protein KBF21_03175 [Thermoanaerobaculia bacterium]|nr:hypothetical protein [Thermoanaerobaculia bacterium]MBP9823205.1 hypothetical protein [Thermoanaerobaculia bacterium]
MKGFASGDLEGLGDLLIDAAAHPEIADWFAVWDTILPRGLAGERREPLFASRFGTLFYARQDGTCCMLDVFFGDVQELAPDSATLAGFAANPAWQETYLLAASVRALHAAGVVARGTECYAIAPHPAVGGPDPWAEDRLDPAAIMVLEGGPWQALCVDFLRRARQASGAGEVEHN